MQVPFVGQSCWLTYKAVQQSLLTSWWRMSRRWKYPPLLQNRIILGYQKDKRPAEQDIRQDMENRVKNMPKYVYRHLWVLSKEWAWRTMVIIILIKGLNQRKRGSESVKRICQVFFREYQDTDVFFFFFFERERERETRDMINLL